MLYSTKRAWISNKTSLVRFDWYDVYIGIIGYSALTTAVVRIPYLVVTETNETNSFSTEFNSQ